ncbi:armadillo repeat-containing X-linked protein 5 [Alexandromys fortis]|uniref:armadillo repeat-containing X-linked protein 5 n=1 Tax=Alexandromys fortis TaxID=100897 RepID=UPI002152DF7B|nr:armadillo repeat-containing X-linked protein 5 [Microtus fortis]XP_049986356.1 armadillo repeat-containing X-linked protein 5 [Microtus fortis]XP_049986357.1 armadillo repeat-containing X-linked protein 5 [Microtus fortis]XP_049986358.1 armadillo repeat-containing X-linked protein 5 [Microtus fortis]
MIGSTAKSKGREESGASVKPRSKKGKAKSQTKKVVETEPKEELGNQAEARSKAMARTQTVTHTEPETVTWKVKKKKDKTSIIVKAQTKTELLKEPGLVPHSKSDASPMSVVITVTKSEVKVDAAIEASGKCSAKASDKGSMKHKPEIKNEICVKSGAGSKTSIVINTTDDDEEYVCSWFWTGEEPSVGSWFWPKDEYPLQVYQPPPKFEEEPEPADTFDFTLKKKAAAWARGRFIVLVPVEEGERPLLPEGNWTLVDTLIETPLGVRPLTKIPPFEGPYFQTLAEIKEQIREREKYGPNPKTCRCKSRTFSLEPVEFDKLVDLLRLTRDPFIHEIATMITGISPAYPLLHTQDIVHDVGITVMIENFVNNPNAKKYPRNLNVSASSDASDEAKENEAHVNKVCRDILCCPLNCSVQVEELKLLASLSIKFDYHHVIVNYVRYFITLLSKGSVKIIFQILRVILYLSKNQANTRELISAEVLSSLVALFHKKESKANILHIIDIFENINFQFKKRAKLFTKEMFTKSELISIFHEAKEFDQKLNDLAEHSDPDVRDKVIRLILKL